MRGAYKTKYIEFRGFEMKISTQAEKGARVVDTLALFSYHINIKSIKKLDKCNKHVQFLIMLLSFNY